MPILANKCKYKRGRKEWNQGLIRINGKSDAGFTISLFLYPTQTRHLFPIFMFCIDHKFIFEASSFDALLVYQILYNIDKEVFKKRQVQNRSIDEWTFSAQVTPLFYILLHSLQSHKVIWVTKPISGIHVFWNEACNSLFVSVYIAKNGYKYGP